LKKTIRVYKSGIHYGEEKVIAGNERSGMIYFSGCHLKCNFCYTPEMSKECQGQDYSSDQFFKLLENLLIKGAKNINFITPSHIWSELRPLLMKFKSKYPHTPLIIKPSGYQGKRMAKEMLEVADILVPDFKVISETAAIKLNLPKNYGKNLNQYIQSIQNNHSKNIMTNEKITKGVLIRHLMMPQYHQETIDLIHLLLNKGYKGVLNLMDVFIDPKTKRLKRATTEIIKEAIQLASSGEMVLLFNGKEIEEKVYV
jgi:putative pyruvate formate lyase activating enzyme